MWLWMKFCASFRISQCFQEMQACITNAFHLWNSWFYYVMFSQAALAAICQCPDLKQLVHTSGQEMGLRSCSFLSIILHLPLGKSSHRRAQKCFLIDHIIITIFVICCSPFLHVTVKGSDIFHPNPILFQWPLMHYSLAWKQPRAQFDAWQSPSSPQYQVTDEQNLINKLLIQRKSHFLLIVTLLQHPNGFSRGQSTFIRTLHAP